MIDRYSRPEMAAVWSAEAKFSRMMDVEISVAKTQAQLGLIPKRAAREIEQKAKFNVKRISEIEQVTKHDVIAFVTNLAENVGPMGRYIHYGLTSSDVLDTALSLQIRDAGEVLLESVESYKKSLKKQIEKHVETLCCGRTHGMFAEITSFGVKLSGFYAELLRNENRLKTALQQIQICKLSGAVGTYSGQDQIVENKLAKRLKLVPETLATQVIPRDRHAELLWSMAMMGTGLERLAVELRHLQRSEVSEVLEGFSIGQKGSSAMPHKKNPISAENLTGLSRLLKSYVNPSLENISLWHERDISHSSVERVVFPDAFILLHYALYRAKNLLDSLQVNQKRMLANIESSQGQIFSSQVLLLLVRKGISRETAYAHIQRLCHSLGTGDHLRSKIKEDKELSKLVTSKELDLIFSGKSVKKKLKSIVKRVI